MKIRYSFLAAALLLMLAPVTCFGTEVAEAVICRDVADQQPVEPGTSFPANIGKVWCWSKIKDGEGTVISHKYYYKNREMASVDLEICSPLFRTYSSKLIVPGWKGQWRVDIVDEQNNVLKSLEFTIGEMQKAEPGSGGEESSSME
jgi:hypothetical protein